MYAPQVQDLGTLLGFIKFMMEAALPILVGIAVIYFIWSLLMFLRESGSKKDEARGHMLWGIVILFVMVSIWGLVNILGSSLGGVKTAPTDLDTTLLPQ